MAFLRQTVESRRDGLKVAQDVVLGRVIELRASPEGTAEIHPRRSDVPYGTYCRVCSIYRGLRPGLFFVPPSQKSVEA
jgi:hypothetical protein